MTTRLQRAFGFVGQTRLLQLLGDHAGRRQVGSTGRTRGCRRCRARHRASASVSASRSNASSSSKVPCTNRIPSASRSHTSCRNGVRACFLTASQTSLPKSSSAQSRRAKPTSANVARQQPAVGQVVDRRHQLLGGQVAGDAEDHHTARARDARHPLVALVPQRVRHPVGAHFFGGVELTLRRLEQLQPGLLELLHALVLEHA